MGNREHKKSKKREKKSRSGSNLSSSSNYSSSSSDSLSSLDEETKKKLLQKIKKLKKKEKKRKKEKRTLKKLKKKIKLREEGHVNHSEVNQGSSASLVKDASGEKSKSLAPMTKEEWEKQQNTFKHVLDKETGRMRLVKGTGEIVEECVSRKRHLEINKLATKGDGEYFQKVLRMEKSDVVEKFFGVYLLKCLNPKYKGRTYIGFTVDPNRRIMQHNKGKQHGGAWRTSQRGPWEMTLTVHGFPSDVAALRFEWAWQHPKRSRRLKTIISNKKASESSFDYCLKVMFTMLSIPPWCRLPLTLRWLSADVMVEPPPNLNPPMHMPIVYGPVKSKKVKTPQKKSEVELLHMCQLCQRLLNADNYLVCLNAQCQVRWHILCLGKHFLDNEGLFTGTQFLSLNSENIIPVEGTCPSCQCAILWGDLIRKKNGCYREESNSEINNSVEDEDLFS